IEDPLVDDAALGVPEGETAPTPRAAWFQRRTWLPAKGLCEQSRYDFTALGELTRQVNMQAGKAGLQTGELTAIAGQLLEALREDEQEFEALNADLRAKLQPYARAGDKAGASHAEFSTALNSGLAWRQEFGAAATRAVSEARAPFHLTKTSRETDKALADADAGYVGLVREFYPRVARCIGMVAERVDVLAADVRNGWATGQSIERYLWREGFDRLLAAAADVGPHATGDPDLHWQAAPGTLAWVVPGVRQVMEENANTIARAHDKLYAIRDAAEATYCQVFSNRARLSHPTPAGAPSPAPVPACPEIAGTRKLVDADPAIGKITWTPDGAMLAWHSQPASIQTVPTKGGSASPLPNTAGWFGGTGTSPAFTPNGLLMVHEGPWSGGRRITETLNGETKTFSSDETAELVFRRADGTGLQSLLTVNASEIGISDITRLQVAPDGRLFLGWQHGDASGYGWMDPDTGDLAKTVVPGGTLDPDLSADGNWVAYTVRGTKRLMLAPAAGGSPRDLGTIARDPALSPRGEWVAYCYGDTVMVAPTAGGKPRLLLRADGVSMLSWSPRGDAIACRRFSEGDVGLWLFRLR
ncbi:MAG: hypothetical protein QM473_13725, partial [Acidobacteriota bacterium]|nr:hypothetical protein [Acidobacteriota bacterium]